MNHLLCMLCAEHQTAPNSSSPPAQSAWNTQTPSYEGEVNKMQQAAMDRSLIGVKVKAGGVHDVKRKKRREQLATQNERELHDARK
jgi:hypothetical protein